MEEERLYLHLGGALFAKEEEEEEGLYLRIGRVLRFALVSSIHCALAPGLSHRVFRIKPAHTIDGILVK